MKSMSAEVRLRGVEPSDAVWPEDKPDGVSIDSLRNTPMVRLSARSAESRLRARKWPILMTVLIVGSGMAFMLCWPTVIEHKHGWETGGDLWGIFRAAHYIGWGFLGGAYDPTTGVNSLPGLEILLAPVAMLSGHLGLTESFPPFFLPHPTAALLLEPIELLLASTVLFAADSLAESLAVPWGRRRSLCLMIAVIAWPTVAIWGHAEDCLALALAIYSFGAVLDSRWKLAGWLFGVALLVQPLVIMMLPLLIATSPRRHRVGTLVRSVGMAAALAVVAFASDFSNAYRSLIQQPTPPSINHATPWVSLAPRVTNVVSTAGHYATITSRGGKYLQGVTNDHPHAVILVSGGAGRAIEVVLAVLVGLSVWRRPQSPDRLIWLAALCLGMRCMFEAVMTPYYLAPPLILALAIASRQGRLRFIGSCAVGLGMTIYAYQNLNPWQWWLPIAIGMTAVLALGFPSDRGGLFHSMPVTPSGASESRDDLSFRARPRLTAPSQ